MRRTDPKGQQFPPSAFVFGNEVGERVKSVQKAWTKTCKRAGIVGLHLHDLRREFAQHQHDEPVSLDDDGRPSTPHVEEAGARSPNSHKVRTNRT